MKYRFVRYTFRFVRSPVSILFLSILSSRRLQDMSSRRLQDMSSRHLQDMSSRRLQHMSSRRLQEISSRRLQDMSSRRLQDVVSVTIFHYPRRLVRCFQDVLEDVNCYAEDVLKTSSRQQMFAGNETCKNS